MENWKDIKGYKGLYKVSSYGRIMTVRNKTKYNFPIEGVGYDGKVCVEFLNYKDAQKKGFDRTLIKKAVDTGKPYKGIHYRIKIEK